MNPLAEQLIVNILASEMGLDLDHIWIRDQNKVVPPGSEMFVVVGMVTSEIIASSNDTVPNSAGMEEVQTVITMDHIQIDLLSRSNEAILRRWEPIGALASIYSEQQQETNNFYISPNPISFLNTSYAEGGSQINRFSITMACQVWYKKTKQIESIYGDYYDDFTARVDDEDTIQTTTPFIEFEINSEGIT